MKKRSFIILSLLICLNYIALAQSNIRINNYWDVPYLINPASFNSRYSTMCTLAARRQWINFPGSPSTFSASVTTLFHSQKVQLGLKAYRDKIGYTASTYVSGSYTYSTELNESWRMNMALAPSYQELSYDLSKVNIDNQDDYSVLSESTHEKSINTDIGIEFVYPTLRIGYSSQNLFSLFVEKKSHQRNTNIAYAIFRSNNDYQVNYGAGISLFQFGRIYHTEASVNVYLKSQREEELFQFGLFYRPVSEMGAIVGFNVSPKFLITYSYDFNVSGISRNSVGTHEIVLVYRIGRCLSCF